GNSQSAPSAGAGGFMLARLVVGLLAVSACGAVVAGAQPASTFRVEEATIASIHAAMRSGSLTCRQLVRAYLDRITAYDKQGPAINALVVVNPRALDLADSLDARFRAG